MRTLLLGAALTLAPAAFAATDAPLATPPGITLQPLGKAQGYDLGKATAAALPRDEIAFTDAKGLTLYTSDKDPLGKSLCDAECEVFWLPVPAPAKAKPVGAWSAIKRDDGRWQWALAGKPVYRFVKDVDPGSIGGNSPARTGAKRIDGAGNPIGYDGRMGGRRDTPKDEPLPEGWRPALLFPSTMPVPMGLKVREVADASALVLVDYRGLTLYAFTGNPKRDTSGKDWEPAPAPQLAEPIGDFTAIMREDGIRQWAYKGRPLYAYAKDHVYGVDANGIGVSKLHEVAAVARYFLPAGVTIARTASQGKVLANAKGMTLYRRDGNIWQSGGGHSLRRGQPARPAVGRDIGTEARCEDQCAKEWHPLLAPADAQPQGYWTVGTRPDGTKQWAYQGYALWTYDGDKKPGDMNGNDTYDFRFSNQAGPQKALEVGTPMDGIPGLYWAVQAP